MAAKWTLQSGNVIGLGGDFDIKGEIGFDGCSVNEIGAALAFGEEENYFAAKVAGTVNILGVPVDVQAGVFVGKACSLGPILFIDPEATNVLSLPPNEFAGIYLEFGAGLSLSQILFGESDCFLDLGVNVSYAVYYDQTSSEEQIGTRQTFGHGRLAVVFDQRQRNIDDVWHRHALALGLRPGGRWRRATLRLNRPLSVLHHRL